MPPSQLTIALRLQSAVDRDLRRRARNVRDRARDNLRGRNGAPPRVATGELLRSVDVGPVFGPAVSRTVRVGTSDPRARWIHDGTGVHGPRRQPIRPRRARALRFRSPDTGRVVFARSVRGMRPNPFLADALRAARD